MKIFTIVEESNIHVAIRLEDDSGNIIGDAFYDLKSSDDFMGISFDAMKSKGSGEIDIPDTEEG